MKDSNRIYEEAYRLYTNVGASAVYDYANKLGLDYRYCSPCETDTPVISQTTCLVCGSENPTDLFEDYHKQPPELRAIISEMQAKDLAGQLDYPDLMLFQARCEAIGYTFDYDLSATPFNLKPIKDE